MEQAVSGSRLPTFNIGDVISSSISIYFKNFVFFTVLYGVFTLPILLYQLSSLPLSGQIQTTDPVQQILFIGYALIAQGLLAAISMYVVVMQLRGNPVSASQAISRGFGRAGYALLAIFVLGIATMIGFALLVIPGIILYCYWYVAIPAATIERSGPIKAASRSVALTQGYRWHIFGLVLIIIIATAVLQQLVLASTGFYNIAGQSHTEILSTVRTMLYFQYFLDIPLGCIPAIASAYAYYVLAIEKDGVGVDEIAKVFE